MKMPAGFDINDHLHNKKGILPNKCEMPFGLDSC
jgi:hypothetical protein